MDERPEDDTDAFKRLAPGLTWLPRVLRHNLRPAVVWGAVGVLISAASAVTLNQVRMASLESQTAKLSQSVETMQATLNDISVRLQVMQSGVTTMDNEIDQERQWRWHVEEGAEIKPYAYPRKKR